MAAPPEPTLSVPVPPEKHKGAVRRVTILIAGFS
jgi:hypothetical protein